MNSDLISRKALKEDFDCVGFNDYDDYKKALRIIDDAPTVKVPENEVNCDLTMFGKCSYNETGCSDCYIKARIRRALDEKCYDIGHADGARLGYEKGLNDARPKGKWLKYTGNGKLQYMCSKCSCEEKNPNEANYCFYCGAKMGGIEE